METSRTGPAAGAMAASQASLDKGARMAMTRRDFLRHGVGAFTIGLSAPAFLTELAQAQGAGSRSLVVLYLGGGNDALSMLVPYGDAFYYSRRPSIAIPAGDVLQIGSDRNSAVLGLHPRLTGIQGPVRRGAAGHRPAHRLRELEPVALPRPGHLGLGQPGEPADEGLARPVPRHAAVAREPARGLGRAARGAPGADERARVRARHSVRRGVHVCQPEQRQRSRAGAGLRPAHRLARAHRPAAPRVREQQHRRRDELARQGGARHEVRAEPDVSRPAASARR